MIALFALVGFLSGWFFGIKGILICIPIFTVLFVAYVVYYTEKQMKQFKDAMKKDEAYWKERAKTLPGIKI